MQVNIHCKILLQYLLQFVKIINDSYNMMKLHLEGAFLISYHDILRCDTV
jgi:hypothetical protein